MCIFNNANRSGQCIKMTGQWVRSMLAKQDENSSHLRGKIQCHQTENLPKRCELKKSYWRNRTVMKRKLPDLISSPLQPLVWHPDFEWIVQPPRFCNSSSLRWCFFFFLWSGKIVKILRKLKIVLGKNHWNPRKVSKLAPQEGAEFRRRNKWNPQILVLL